MSSGQLSRHRQPRYPNSQSHVTTGPGSVSECTTQASCNRAMTNVHLKQLLNAKIPRGPAIRNASFFFLLSVPGVIQSAPAEVRRARSPLVQAGRARYRRVINLAGLRWCHCHPPIHTDTLTLTLNAHPPPRSQRSSSSSSPGAREYAVRY